MKAGEKVKIIDGSYMTTFQDGQLSHSSRKIEVIGKNSDTWTVVHTGGIFPTLDDYFTLYFGGGRRRINDTIIQNDRNGEIWYCVAEVSLKSLSPEPVPEYTMEDLRRIVGHEFKIKR